MVELIGVPLTLGSVAVTAIEVLVPHAITTSHTLFAWQLVGAIMGAVLGYLRTSFALLGKGRPACLAASARFVFVGIAVYVLFVLGPLVVAAPSFAERYLWARRIREVLLAPVLLLNALEFFGVAVAAFCLTSSIVALSSRLADPNARLYQRDARG